MSVDGEPSMPTSGGMAPASAMRLLTFWLPSAIFHTAIAASEQTVAAAGSLAFEDDVLSTCTSEM